MENHPAETTAIAHRVFIDLPAEIGLEKGMT